MYFSLIFSKVSVSGFLYHHSLRSILNRSSLGVVLVIGIFVFSITTSPVVKSVQLCPPCKFNPILKPYSSAEVASSYGPQFIQKVILLVEILSVFTFHWKSYQEISPVNIKDHIVHADKLFF